MDRGYRQLRIRHAVHHRPRDGGHRQRRGWHRIGARRDRGQLLRPDRHDGGLRARRHAWFHVWQGRQPQRRSRRPADAVPDQHHRQSYRCDGGLRVLLPGCAQGWRPVFRQHHLRRRGDRSHQQVGDRDVRPIRGGGAGGGHRNRRSRREFQHGESGRAGGRVGRRGVQDRAGGIVGGDRQEAGAQYRGLQERRRSPEPDLHPSNGHARGHRPGRAVARQGCRDGIWRSGRGVACGAQPPRGADGWVAEPGECDAVLLLEIFLGRRAPGERYENAHRAVRGAQYRDAGEPGGLPGGG